MTKFLLSVAFVCATFAGANAQNVLSQTNKVNPTANKSAVACSVGTPATGISESSYFRAYTMSANFDIGSVKIGVGSVTGSFPITVKLYTSSSAFPASYPAGLTQIATVTATLTNAQNYSTVNIPLTTPVSVASGKIVVVEVSNATTTGGIVHYMGVAPSETASSYILAKGCNVNAPTVFTTLNADSRIIIDLVDTTPASTNELFDTKFTMYPNPVSDVLNFTFKDDVSINEIAIIDLSGKVVRTQKGVVSLNVSDLASGTYIVNVSTNQGVATSKFIKK